MNYKDAGKKQPSRIEDFMVIWWDELRDIPGLLVCGGLQRLNRLLG